MTTPTQIEDWRKEFEKSLTIDERQILPLQGYASFRVEFEWCGYIRARTEQANFDRAFPDALKPMREGIEQSVIERQATEIAELKAKLAEVMPLAKFGARVMHKFDAITKTDIYQAALIENLYSVKDCCVRPNIKATITNY